MLNKTERLVLRHIASFINKNGYPPTQREIADLMHWSSVGAANRLLVKLAESGAISWTPNVPRSIQLAGNWLEYASIRSNGSLLSAGWRDGLEELTEDEQKQLEKALKVCP